MCGTVQAPAPPVNSESANSPFVAASSPASTRILTDPMSATRPSPGRTNIATTHLFVRPGSAVSQLFTPSVAPRAIATSKNEVASRAASATLRGMRAYGQFCPVARTAELFAERWTPIIVRNLLNGCRTFSEIRQGAPGIPTALLSQRLDTLQRAGIIEREPARSGRGASYHLTDMGRELKAVCDAMGQWGARWLEIE